MDSNLKLNGIELLSSQALETLPPDLAANLAEFARANAKFDAGNHAEAVELALALIAGRAVNVVTATNTVLLFRESGRDDLARDLADTLFDLLHRRAASRPADLQLLTNIAWINIALKRFDAANALLSQVLHQNPMDEALTTMLATNLTKLGNPDGAIAAWHPIFAARPEAGHLRLSLARRLAADGFVEHAKQMLDLAEPLCQDFRHEFQYIADGIRGTQTAREQAAMTVEIFDSFSQSYDNTLKSLGNRGPQIVEAVLQALNLPKNRKLQVLDAGCGTGLCAPILRPYAKLLHGCDLSSGMLTEAKKKGRYNLLTRSDLASVGTLPPGPFDLIATSDVLVYFGDLAEVLANFARILRPGGWLIVTVEDVGSSGPTRGWELGVSGRHRHGLPYLRAVLAKAGFTAPKVVLNDVLRRESGKPVPGLGLAAQRLSLML